MKCYPCLKKSRKHLASFGTITNGSPAVPLAVTPETYRTWDSGRRAVPVTALSRARDLAGAPNDQALLPLGTLAPLLGIHVRTLRNAGRRRLDVQEFLHRRRLKEVPPERR
jgi:hypothetical protein